MKLPLVAASMLVLATSIQQVYAQDAYMQKFGLESLNMLCILNQLRERIRCNPVTLSNAVSAVATKHSEDMKSLGLMNHTLFGLDPFQRLEAANIPLSAWGENIADGQANVSEVMQDWINSCGKPS
jgi:uncharacterized protein YkwD